MKIDFSAIQPWIPVIAATVGAFLGAIFAVFVSQYNERVKRHRVRWSEHRNVLVQLEYGLNETIAIVADNRRTARKVIDSDFPPKEGQLQVVWGLPQTLPYDSSLPRKLLRIELINALFSHGEHIRKLNHDTTTLCTAYAEMRAGLLGKNLNRDQYLHSLNEYRGGLIFLTKAYDLMDSRIEVLLAQIRATLHRDKRYDEGSFFDMPPLEAITQEKIENERKVLVAEIEEVQRRSKSETDRYLS